MEAIKIECLEKQYKNGKKALNGLSLKVRQGEIFSLLGPNGSGKSTLINILTTYYVPSSGTVTMLGMDLSKNPYQIRKKIACAAQTVSIDHHLTLVENMMFQSRLYQIDNKTARKRMDNLIEDFGLAPYLRCPVASYSGGIKQRLDIAMNMISQPQILFLDEPTVGMDLHSRKAMWNLMGKIRNDFHTTIFLTTHYLEEADQLSDTICIIKDGQEVIQNSSVELRRYTGQNMIRITFPVRGAAEECVHKLTASGFLSEMRLQENNVLIPYSGDRSFLDLTSRHLLDTGIPFEGIDIMQTSLEDVFISLTSTERNK